MILCVTGPMAAGKNAAAAILQEEGFACIDADIAGHQAVEMAKDQILKEFGPLAEKEGVKLINSDGTVNRRGLGALVFSSKDLIFRQESIVYPKITSIIESFVEENKGQDIVINATVLYKLKLIENVDFILYIDAPILQRLIRAKKRDKMPLKQIFDRFKRQKNLFAKYSFCNADIVRVWNTGTRQNLKKKIEKFLAECRQGIK